MAKRNFKIGAGKETTKKNIKVTDKGAILVYGCPKCKDMCVTQLPRLYQGNRSYHCNGCGIIFATPTSYARCDNEYIIRTKNGLIGNDTVINDCLICPIPKKEGFNINSLIRESKACPYFKGPTKLDE
ncbi:MAG: hypothetical protein Q8O68_00785 [Candidatus Daviesbacteria bacterium]|nr:hypothetical protein [Candidatus Daviesbacteria bacterium]